VSALSRLQPGDPVEEIDDEAESGVVEGETSAKSLQPRHGGQLTGCEPYGTGRVARRFDQPESDEAPHHVGMEPGQSGKGVQVEASGSGKGVGRHRCRLGSNVETRASSSNNLRSSSLGVAGTMMRTSA
jgi:hypothetical protein